MPAVLNDRRHQVFAEIRWADTNGVPVCPHCECPRCWVLKSRRRFRCSACRKDF
jgi:hypothetical protein